MKYGLDLPADKLRDPLISSIILLGAVTPPPLPMLSLSQAAPVRLASHPQLPLHTIRLLTAHGLHVGSLCMYLCV